MSPLRMSVVAIDFAILGVYIKRMATTMMPEAMFGPLDHTRHLQFDMKYEVADYKCNIIPKDP